MTTQFEINKKYKGRTVFLVLSKTSKTITIESEYYGVIKLKLSNYGDGYESVIFKSECVTSDDYVKN